MGRVPLLGLDANRAPTSVWDVCHAVFFIFFFPRGVLKNVWAPLLPRPPTPSQPPCPLVFEALFPTAQLLQHRLQLHILQVYTDLQVLD